MNSNKYKIGTLVLLLTVLASLSQGWRFYDKISCFHVSAGVIVTESYFCGIKVSEHIVETHATSLADDLIEMKIPDKKYSLVNVKGSRRIHGEYDSAVSEFILFSDLLDTWVKGESLRRSLINKAVQFLDSNDNDSIRLLCQEIQDSITDEQLQEQRNTCGKNY